jgi:hypothetical protein
MQANSQAFSAGLIRHLPLLSTTGTHVDLPPAAFAQHRKGLSPVSGPEEHRVNPCPKLRSACLFATSLIMAGEFCMRDNIAGACLIRSCAMRCASRKVLVSSLHTKPRLATFHQKSALQSVLIKSQDAARSNSRPWEPRGGCPCNMLGILHGASFHHGPSLIQRERRLFSENIVIRNQAALVRECRAVAHLASTSTELSKPSVSTPNADCGGLGWAFGACPLGSWAMMGTHRTSSQPCLVQASFKSLYFSNLQTVDQI